MSNVSEWNVAASSNTSAPPNGAPEGMAPSTVNNTMREMMAAIARWYQDTNGALESTGSANAYALTTNSGHAALADQSLLVFRADRANTGAATLNVDGLGAKSIRFNDAALVSGQIVADVVYIAAYNATDDAYDLIGSFNASATNLTTGTLPDARLSSNVPLKDANNTFTGARQVISATQPSWALSESDATADNGVWDWQVSSEQLFLRAINDANTVATTILSVSRTGTTVDTINFANGNLQAGGNDVLTTADEGSGNGIDADTVDGIEGASLRDATINQQDGNYTLVLGDAGKTIYKTTGASGETYTIPANASVAFPGGTMVTFVNRGGGDLSIAITNDTLQLAGTAFTGTRTLADGGVATALKLSSTVWVISGAGLS